MPVSSRWEETDSSSRGKLGMRFSRVDPEAAAEISRGAPAIRRRSDRGLDQGRIRAGLKFSRATRDGLPLRPSRNLQFGGIHRSGVLGRKLSVVRGRGEIESAGPLHAEEGGQPPPEWATRWQTILVVFTSASEEGKTRQPVEPHVRREIQTTAKLVTEEEARQRGKSGEGRRKPWTEAHSSRVVVTKRAREEMRRISPRH
ncbi:hypothetical protein KM043_011588 [Ampulex compressa]|nr:hypothetical protein KM043_011588 [Ampulex compressa]